MLGEGAVGKVYKRDNFAVKVIEDNILSIDCLHEIYFLNILKCHPNIPLVHDILTPEKNKTEIYMELCDMDLKSFSDKLSFNEKIKILPKLINDIVSTFQYLHFNNILHGDVKPENILVKKIDDTDTDDQDDKYHQGYKFYLCDFGIAKQYPSTLNVLNCDTIMYTIKNRPPEFFTGEYYFTSFVGNNYSSDYWAFAISTLEFLFSDNPIISLKEHEYKIQPVDYLIFLSKLLTSESYYLKKLLSNSYNYYNITEENKLSLEKIKDKFFSKEKLNYNNIHFTFDKNNENNLNSFFDSNKQYVEFLNACLIVNYKKRYESIKKSTLYNEIKSKHSIGTFSSYLLNESDMKSNLLTQVHLSNTSDNPPNHTGKPYPGSLVRHLHSGHPDGKFSQRITGGFRHPPLLAFWHFADESFSGRCQPAESGCH